MITSKAEPPKENYILLSDVHLGFDLVQHTRPWTADRLDEALELDRQLAGLLDHYRASADPERPWKLIFAGDVIDLVGMCIAPGPDGELQTPLNYMEQTHGLGSAGDHAALKVQAVSARHELVFRKLAEFLAAGHSIVVVRGNHDVELYWEQAQQALLQALVDYAPQELADDPARLAELGRRVEFRHWFYYVEGLLYVDHGHQYDETCAYQYQLAPRCPADPRRISYSFSDILLRFVVRPTRGMSTDGHENQGLLHYLHMAFSMGIAGCARLGFRFSRAVWMMCQRWRLHIDERAAAIRQEHERRMHEVADRFALRVERVRALAALSAVPVTERLRSILRSVFLDGLAGLALTAMLVVVLAVFDLLEPLGTAALALGLSGALAVYIRSSRVVDARVALRRGAERVAELFPARFVVMGHTHDPRMEPLNGQSTYVNLGHWSVDDLDAKVAPAPCTYLVLRAHGGRHQAELLTWSAGSEPTRHALSEAPKSAAA